MIVKTATGAFPISLVLLLRHWIIELYINCIKELHSTRVLFIWKNLLRQETVNPAAINTQGYGDEMRYRGQGNINTCLRMPIDFKRPNRTVSNEGFPNVTFLGKWQNRFFFRHICRLKRRLRIFTYFVSTCFY